VDPTIRELDPAELRSRRDALRYATASVALEGLQPPSESDRRAALHAEGKITFAQMIDLDAPCEADKGHGMQDTDEAVPEAFETALTHCAAHGPQEETFVCRHLAESLRTQQGVGWFGSSEPRGDAWCQACEAVRIAQGGPDGEWTERSEAFAQITVLCAVCYDQVRAINGASQASPTLAIPPTVQERMLETARQLGNDPTYRDKLKDLLF
jgi:hypothetical protein